MLVALSSIAAEQANPTEDTMAQTKQLLDYAATHPDAKLHYLASDMQLRIDSDASYLNAPHARSRIGGHHYLSNAPPPMEQSLTPQVSSKSSYPPTPKPNTPPCSKMAKQES
jgi:hypothetical protein